MKTGLTPDEAQSIAMSNFKKGLEIVGKCNKKYVRKTASLFPEQEFVEIPIIGDIVPDKKLGNKVIFRK